MMSLSFGFKRFTLWVNWILPFRIFSVFMLLGFEADDDSDECFDFVLPVAGEASWQPAASRREVSESFRDDLQNLTGLRDDEEPVHASVSAAVDVSVSSAIQLLRWTATCGEFELHFPRSRKRLRGKQVVPLGESLYRLQQDPECDSGQRFTWADRKLGFYQMARCVARKSGSSVRAILPSCRELWRNTSLHVRNNWTVLAKISASLFAVPEGQQGRSLRSSNKCVGDTPYSTTVHAPLLQCYGFLGTWNTSLGLDDAEVGDAVRSGFRGDQLIAIMKGMKLYRDAFDSLAEHVARWSAEYHFETHAVSMELCMHGSSIQRVHLHAFLGPPVDNAAWGCRRMPSVVDVACLKWQGHTPMVRCIRPHARLSILRHEAIGGVYYVLMKKPGSMFRSGNKWPFQDSAVHSVTPLIFRCW
jgi:hypothetical protein